jgi:site-specific recombinase XerD
VIAAYLRRERRETPCRALFMTAKGLVRRLGSSAVCQIVQVASRRCGLAPLGAHRLRHTAATEMLRGGASLPQIAQALRHRSLDTTAIYAKVDRVSLRTVARAWPGAKR